MSKQTISKEVEATGVVNVAQPANLDEAVVSGGTENKHGHPDEVRKKNAIHRDSRTRLGKGKSSLPVIE